MVWQNIFILPFSDLDVCILVLNGISKNFTINVGLSGSCQCLSLFREIIKTNLVKLPGLLLFLYYLFTVNLIIL